MAAFSLQMHVIQQLLNTEQQAMASIPANAAVDNKTLKRVSGLRMQLEQYSAAKSQWKALEEDHKANEHSRKAVHKKWVRFVKFSEHRMKLRARKAFRREVRVIWWSMLSHGHVMFTLRSLD